MKWQEVRARLPHQWLLLEALNARSEGDKRILDELAVFGSFPDSKTALKRYAQLRREMPTRELYVFHTDREELEITELRWLGLRGQT